MTAGSGNQQQYICQEIEQTVEIEEKLEEQRCE